MAKNSNKIKLSKGDRTFTIINYIILTIAMLIVLYPMIFVVSASFSNAVAVKANKVWLWPVGFNLEGYKAALKHPLLFVSFWNSVKVTVIGTTTNMVLTFLVAYPLSIRGLWGKTVLTWLWTFTMLFSGGMIPLYLVVQRLGLLDTFTALFLPGAVSVYNMIIARTNIQSIPYDMYESAQLDGCSDFRYFLQFVLPLSKSILAVLTLYYAVGHWNGYFAAMMYLTSKEKFTFQLILREIIINNTVDPTQMLDADVLLRKQGLKDLLKYSTVVVATVPMMIVYPFVQKHFVKGVMIGSIKG